MVTETLEKKADEETSLRCASCHNLLSSTNAVYIPDHGYVCPRGPLGEESRCEQDYRDNEDL